MDEKLNELKEKQAEIGDKISLLQATNKKKDEEAAEIRQLIAECRENLNRIKGLAPGSQPVLAPCPEYGDPGDPEWTANPSAKESERPSQNTKKSKSPRDSESSGREGDSPREVDSAKDGDSAREGDSAKEGDSPREVDSEKEGDSTGKGESGRNSKNSKSSDPDKDSEHSDKKGVERDTDSVRSKSKKSSDSSKKNDSNRSVSKGKSELDNEENSERKSGGDRNSGSRSDQGKKSDSGNSDRKSGSGKDGNSDRKSGSGRDGNSDRRSGSGRDGNSDKRSGSGRDGNSDKRSDSGRDGNSDKRSESGRDGDSIRSNRLRNESEPSKKNDSDRESKSSSKKGQDSTKNSVASKGAEFRKTDSTYEELLRREPIEDEESAVKSQNRNLPGKTGPQKTKVGINKKRFADVAPKPESVQGDTKKKKGRDGERVSCKVDLNKMKVRIRGPSEDLKKLDATQLINLLEKFQCQELIINTGEEIIQDPGEIRLVYFLHPGNIVMVAGIIMIAFLINTNLCNVQNSCRTKFLLKVLYISSFAFHYGMVFWMSFIRGFALKFGVDRDTYFLVDNLVLPKYYSACVLLSALSLYSLLATHCTSSCTSWPLEVLAQMIVAVVTFVMELITICYIIPALVKLREATEDYAMDEEEPESSPPESYEKNLVKLSKLNWTVCLINVLTLIFLGANMYYMTTKLDIGDN